MRGALERWIHSVWYGSRSGGLAWLLLPVSWLYALVVWVRKRLYGLKLLSSYRSVLPVIVVGNVTAGGVGKTPFVVWLVDYLTQQGRRPGVMTRGYGGTLKESTRVSPAHSAQEVGDEALMLARRLEVPVVAGARRMDSAAKLEALGVDIIVSDDGLQHYALERDIQICVIDEHRGFGNGRLIPAGPLRESKAAVNAMDIVVYHRATLEPDSREGDTMLSGMALGQPRLRQLTTSQYQKLESLRGQAVHAVAGIGNPARFFNSLSLAGLKVTTHAFPDHHGFVASDLEFGDEHPVLMTEKDAVKCEPFARDNMFAVTVDTLVSPDIETSVLDALASLKHN